MAAVLDSTDLDVSAAQKVLVAVVVPELQFPDANNQENVGVQEGPLHSPSSLLPRAERLLPLP